MPRSPVPRGTVLMNSLYSFLQFPSWVGSQLLMAITSPVMYSLTLLISYLALPILSSLLPGITFHINDLYSIHCFAFVFEGTETKTELKVIF